MGVALGTIFSKTCVSCTHAVSIPAKSNRVLDYIKNSFLSALNKPQSNEKTAHHIRS